MTDDEFYRYVQDTGQSIKRAVTRDLINRLPRMSDQDAKKALEGITTQARKNWRVRNGFSD